MLPDLIAEPLQLPERYEPLDRQRSLLVDIPDVRRCGQCGQLLERNPHHAAAVCLRCDPESLFARNHLMSAAAARKTRSKPAKPAQPIDRDAALRSALLRTELDQKLWAELKLTHNNVLDSQQILTAVSETWAGDYKEHGEHGEVNLRGGEKPAIWFGPKAGKPDLQDMELVTAVRRVLDISDNLTGLANGRVKGKSGKFKAPAATPADDQAREALGKMVLIEEREMRLEEIIPSAENPREDWDEAFLRTLGESIRDHGQFDPVIVREDDGRGFHEIVDGESRYRGAQLVGLKTLTARIVRCTDADAAMVRVLSYRQRRDLNPIEEARGLKLLLHKYGCSQRQLEERVGISQAQISNRVRLLKIPEAWQKRVVAGEISASGARAMAAWADVPEFWKEANSTWSNKFAKEEFLDNVPRGVNSILHEITEPLKGSHYNHAINKNITWAIDLDSLAPDQQQALRIRDIPDDDGKTEPRAFNVGLAKQLQAAAKAAVMERAAKKADKQDEAAKKLSTKEQKARQEQLEKQYHTRLARYLVGWYQGRIAAMFGELTDTQLMDYTLHFVAADGHIDRLRSIEAKADEFQPASKRKGQASTTGWPLDAWRKIPEDDRRDAWVAMLCEWICSTTEGYRRMVRPQDVLMVANDFGVSLDEWTVTHEFLELHTSAQLLALCEEWGHYAGPPKECSKRGDMLAWIGKVCGDKPAPKVLRALNVAGLLK